MLLVKTTIGPSTIPDAGIGLFAAEAIKKGTLVWKFKEGFDMRFDPEFIETLPEAAKEFFAIYPGKDPNDGRYNLCVDNARFFNHSDSPNVSITGSETQSDVENFALRDIAIGEELFVDYRLLDEEPGYGISK